MSSIFKTRKTPKHLIIDEYPRTRPGKRIGFLRVLLWVTLSLVLTGVFLQTRVLLGL